MPDLPDTRGGFWLDRQPPARLLRERLPRQTRNALAAIQHSTTVRLAGVRGEGLVATVKTHELNHVDREAMTGHALLYRCREALAAGDPFLNDELRLLTDTARLGAAEIIADLVADFCRESRS
jgi:hypothetical protein